MHGIGLRRNVSALRRRNVSALRRVQFLELLAAA
jgi:hypothetical protein